MRRVSFVFPLIDHVGDVLNFLNFLKLCTCAESGGCQRFFGAVSVFSKANCGHCFSFLKKRVFAFLSFFK